MSTLQKFQAIFSRKFEKKHGKGRKNFETKGQKFETSTEVFRNEIRIKLFIILKKRFNHYLMQRILLHLVVQFFSSRDSIRIAISRYEQRL